MKHKTFNNAREFRNYLENREFKREINKIILHQLWVNPKNHWWGEESIIGLSQYYKNQGRSFAFNLCIADNKIWSCKNLSYEPDQSGREEINEGSIVIEIDSVVNGRQPSPKNWQLYLETIKALMNKFNLEPNRLFTHRRFHDTLCTDFDEEYVLQGLNKLI